MDAPVLHQQRAVGAVWGMSSYVYMKLLESAPWRYDAGIRRLSRGRIDAIYRAIAELVAAPGRRILDLGSGTGGVALACAARGARVIGIDRSAEMLAVARAKPVPAAAGGAVEFIELGALEIEDRFEPATFDAVVASLLFSELSGDEQRYLLDVVRTRLRPAGTLVVADEVLPPAGAPRLWYRLQRMPRAALTYLLTQTSTRAVQQPATLVREAGFEQVQEQLLDRDFAIVAARRPEAPR